MKNLTIGRLALGVLMMFVLALGVVGIADAITALDTPVNDLQTAVTGVEFSVGFTPTLVATSGTIKSTYANYTATETIDGVEYRYIDHPTTGTQGQWDSGEPRVTSDLAFHYNSEAVTISVSGAGARITGIGTVGNINPSVPSVILKESGTGANALTAGAVTVYCSTTSYGKVTVTVRDTTPSEDYPSGISRAPHLVLTTYVVRYTRDVSRTAVLRLLDVNNGVAIGHDDQSNQPIYNGDGSHYPVTYVVTGGGTVQIQEGNRIGVAANGTAGTSITTSSAAKVLLDMNSVTNTVAATISGSYEDPAQGIYIFGNPQLNITGTSSPQSGAPGTSVATDLHVTVTDSTTASTPVVGVPVKFDVTDKTLSGGILNGAATTGIIVDASNNEIESPLPGSTQYVRTGASGIAEIGFQLGTVPGEQTVIVSALGIPALTKTFRLTATPTAATRQLSVKGIHRQGSTNIYTLVARVENGGTGDAGETVTFRITGGRGTLTSGSTTSQTVTATTNSGGDASVIYNTGDDSGVATVEASISVVDTTTTIVTHIQTVTFNVRGGSSGPTNNPPTGSPYLSLSTRSLTGSPGEQRSFTVTAYDASNQRQNINVNLSSSGVTVPSSVRSGESVSITLPSSSTSISVSASGYSPQSITVTVAAAASRIVRVSGDSPVQTGEPGRQLSSPFVVRVDDRSNNPLRGQTVTFRVTGGGGSVSPTTATTDSNGQASTTLTLGSAGGTNTVTASVGALSPITFTATARTIIARLEIDEGNNQSGEINSVLSQPLVVRITDQDGNGIPGQSVTFSTVEGSGRFSPIRSQIRTDRDGYASVSFTPRSAGTIEVEAASGDLTPVTFTITTGDPPDAIVMVSGNNQSGRPGARLANPFVVEVVDENDAPVSGVTVTFAVTAGGGSVSPTSATTNNNGRAQTRLTLGEALGDNTVTARVSGVSRAATFTARTGAEVLVEAANRPPMYWVSRTEGKLHRLVGAEVENLAPNIDNILSLTVDTQNQLLYWTRQTAQSKSAIQRAGLNGRGVITLQTSLTLMTSIAVDSTGTTLYWADILGKIKSRPVQGNRVTLLAQNLSSPTGLVWSNEYLYWGEATGQIRRMNLRNNRRTIETITTSSGEPVSLAVRSGRVYWTEISGNASQLNRVNTNGTGVEALKTLAGSRRVWIDVDGSSSKIYLTRASKLERRGLSGQSTVTLVSGLASPGSLVLGGELPTSPPVVSQPTQPTQPTQPPVASKYDVNQDGSVNNADTRAVAGAVGQSGAAITNPRTDVDGSGTVDVTDLILVIANLDADVAAPTIDIDVKALDVDFDRVQEQVEVLLASGDRSIAAQRALLYLQHLLASARPDETVLLANYPNPFNPETWIPYHLAESTEVRVNIYDAQGVLVRVLPLGHQPAGYYTSRNRAAYWDGKNALGERVASGIYFYQLQTDETSPMRKMVILK